MSLWHTNSIPGSPLRRVSTQRFPSRVSPEKDLCQSNSVQLFYRITISNSGSFHSHVSGDPMDPILMTKQQLLPEVGIQ